MKNQYFADKRDYFKYDLLLYLMERADLFRRLTFVPMLTPDGGTDHGSDKGCDLEGGNEGLRVFLQCCIDAGMLDIRLLRLLFCTRGITYCPYRDTSDFQHRTRTEYFAGIPDEYLCDALVFLDPDVGLEKKTISNRDGNAYVKSVELASLLGRMSAESALMLFQAHHHEEVEKFLPKICQRLSEEATMDEPICVSHRQQAFFFSSRSQTMRTGLRQALREYAASRSTLLYDSAQQEEGIVQPGN